MKVVVGALTNKCHSLDVPVAKLCVQRLPHTDPDHAGHQSALGTSKRVLAHDARLEHTCTAEVDGRTVVDVADAVVRCMHVLLVHEWTAADGVPHCLCVLLVAQSATCCAACKPSGTCCRLGKHAMHGDAPEVLVHGVLGWLPATHLCVINLPVATCTEAHDSSGFCKRSKLVMRHRPVLVNESSGKILFVRLGGCVVPRA